MRTTSFVDFQHFENSLHIRLTLAFFFALFLLRVFWLIGSKSTTVLGPGPVCVDLMLTAEELLGVRFSNNGS